MTGIPLPSQLTVQINCDNAPGLTVVAATEVSPCHTLITAHAEYACTE